MSECPKATNCAFFKKAEAEGKKLALKVMQKEYCRGSKQEECKRMELSLKKGGEYVPDNMCPDGTPLIGTDKADWPEEVK